MNDESTQDPDSDFEDDAIECPPDWHERFFDGLWLEVQAHTFDPSQTREHVDAAQEALQLMPGSRVLDVPCGEGRIALEMASRGYVMTGVDRVPSLLDRARSQAAARGIEAHWAQSDMWDLQVEGTFDAALCLWSSLGYGTEDEDRRFLTAVGERLEPGGGLLIETHVTETLLPWFEPHGFRWAGDIAVTESRRFDPTAGRIVTEWILSAADRRETSVSSLRLYSFRELVNLLDTAGFDVSEAFGSTDLEPFELGASRLFLAATRR